MTFGRLRPIFLGGSFWERPSRANCAHTVRMEMDNLLERVALAIEQAEINFHGLAVTDPALSRGPSQKSVALARAAIKEYRKATAEGFKLD